MRLRIARKTRPAKTQANLRSSQKKKKNVRTHLVLGLSPREDRDNRKPRLRRRYVGLGLAHEKICGLSRCLDRYNPSNIGILEDYLYHQTRSEEYDCLANLAVLKLSVVSPDVPIAINSASDFSIQISVQFRPIQLRRRDPHPHKSSHILPIPRLPPMRFAARRAAIVRKR